MTSLDELQKLLPSLSRGEESADSQMGGPGAWRRFPGDLIPNGMFPVGSLASCEPGYRFGCWSKRGGLARPSRLRSTHILLCEQKTWQMRGLTFAHTVMKFRSRLGTMSQPDGLVLCK